MYLRGRSLNFYAPTDIAADYDLSAVLPPPEEQLKLEWVYGYRGKDCRNNVVLLPTGEIIYFVAAVVVLYHLEQHSQRHYLEHSDDIKW
ncbi:77 kDa echinoderm microtubule-associated protein [Taenia solium]|eukprot:TsM_001028100 transcript=TsM_001028100 gene=TsM_001028100